MRTFHGLLPACIAAALLAASCGGAVAQGPTPPPTSDPTAGLSAPPGPVLFEPEQLIFPPEDFPIRGAEVARDAPVAVRGWERQFATPSSTDFRWFTVRLFVLEPDVRPETFVAQNGCGSVTWPDPKPVAQPVAGPPTMRDARACRYTFAAGARVLYLVTGYRNMGLLVGTQPRREEVTDALALDWLDALARDQIAIVEKVLIAHPPPTVGQTSTRP